MDVLLTLTDTKWPERHQTSAKRHKISTKTHKMTVNGCKWPQWHKQWQIHDYNNNYNNWAAKRHMQMQKDTIPTTRRQNWLQTDTSPRYLKRDAKPAPPPQRHTHDTPQGDAINTATRKRHKRC